MKCIGENVILRGIVHVVSGFPLHFMFYRGNLDCFSNRVRVLYLIKSLKTKRKELPFVDCRRTPLVERHQTDWQLDFYPMHCSLNGQCHEISTPCSLEGQCHEISTPVFFCETYPSRHPRAMG